MAWKGLAEMDERKRAIIRKMDEVIRELDGYENKDRDELFLTSILLMVSGCYEMGTIGELSDFTEPFLLTVSSR
jgi:hypothetical protein